MRWSIFLAACVVGLGALYGGCGAAEETRKVVAVTAFANLNKDPAQDWLSTGIGETLTVKLAQVPTLMVVERMRMSEAMKELQLQDTALVEPGTAAKLGQMVGAQTVVVGAIQRSGDELRVTARFVEAATGTVSNTAQADGKIDEVFDIQDRLAAALLSTLGVQVSAEVEAKVKANPTQDMAAYEAYSKGISSMNAGNYEDAAKQLQAATDKDPSFKLAQQTLQFVRWARPNARSAVYLAKLDAPFKKVYDAMLAAVKTAEGYKLCSEDGKAGKIAARAAPGQDINIEIKPLDTMTGINILSQTRRGWFGIRQKVDWGQSKKSIGRLLRVFFEQMGIPPPRQAPTSP